MDANTTQAVSMVDIGFVRGVITALTMAVFFGITWWAYHRGNRKRFEEDALMVFGDDEIARHKLGSDTRSESGEGEES